MAKRVCTFADCGKPHYGNDLCQGHARQRRAGEDLRPLRQWTSQTDKAALLCLISRCENPRKGNQALCAVHYNNTIRYKISQPDYAALYDLGCQVCKAQDVLLSVDHDHSCCPERKRSCGKCIRGLLCAKCNFLAGFIDTTGLPWQEVVYNLAWYYEQYDLTRLPAERAKTLEVSD